MQKNNKGIAMIEVLISLGIISVVLLSLLSYQISMIKSINESRLKTIATFQLDNFSEMLRMHISNSARQSALRMWNKDNARLLPQGMGYFNEVDDHQCKITVRWFLKKTKSESMTVFC